MANGSLVRTDTGPSPFPLPCYRPNSVRFLRRISKRSAIRSLKRTHLPNPEQNPKACGKSVRIKRPDSASSPTKKTRLFLQTVRSRSACSSKRLIGTSSRARTTPIFGELGQKRVEGQTSHLFRPPEGRRYLVTPARVVSEASSELQCIRVASRHCRFDVDLS